MTALVYPEAYHGGTWYRWEAHGRNHALVVGDFFAPEENTRDADFAAELVEAKGKLLDGKSENLIWLIWTLVRYESTIHTSIERAE